jgi:Copper type II ascorbate-dependent monooxygenase, C-terminal domain
LLGSGRVQTRAFVLAIAALAQLLCATAQADLLTPLTAPKVKKPHRGMQMQIGPIDVPHSSEITVCTYFKNPMTKDMAVNHVRIMVQGGSHHIHLYRPVDPNMTLADGHETCNFALNFDVWQLILASQNTMLDWKLPKGVAFMFRAGEQLAAQTHFVDNGLLSTPDPGWATFNLYATKKKKVKSFAGAFFGQDRDVKVPPHSTAVATTRCVFPRPVKLLALTGHYHFRGKEFTVNTWDGQTTGEELYKFEGYTEPYFQRYSGKFQPEVPGLEWTCRYENDTDNEFTFGPFTDKNEHCNLFGFYYPTLGEQEFMTCVQKDSVVTVNVRN